MNTAQFSNLTLDMSTFCSLFFIKYYNMFQLLVDLTVNMKEKLKCLFVLDKCFVGKLFQYLCQRFERILNSKLLNVTDFRAN